MKLALDLGTKLGWATYNQGVVNCGTLRMDKCKSDFSIHGARYLMLENWLESFPERPLVIGYEDVKRHAGTLAAHAYGGYLAIVQKYAHTYDIPLQAYGVGEIKKHATGKGNASKQEVFDAVVDKYGICPVDDNASDALAILSKMGAK